MKKLEKGIRGAVGRDWWGRGVHIRVERRYADGGLRSLGPGDMSIWLGPEGHAQRDLNGPPLGCEADQLQSPILH